MLRVTYVGEWHADAATDTQNTVAMEARRAPVRSAATNTVQFLSQYHSSPSSSVALSAATNAQHIARRHVPPLPGHTRHVMPHQDNGIALAEAERTACLNAAMLAYEDAGIRGLCAEGRACDGGPNQ